MVIVQLCMHMHFLDVTHMNCVQSVYSIINNGLVKYVCVCVCVYSYVREEDGEGEEEGEGENLRCCLVFHYSLFSWYSYLATPCNGLYYRV